MRARKGPTILVAGGTGNVGGFIVDALLQRGATVAVPSRSGAKLDALRDFLAGQGRAGDLDRLVGHIGNLGDPAAGPAILADLEERAGPLDGALASLGNFRPARSVLTAPLEDFDAVLDGYLLAHLRVARAVLPRLAERGGTYVFINGPLAFDVWPGSGAGLVSIATAAQHMLFRVLAQEFDSHRVKVNEVVTHAFIRNRTTQPQSPIRGEDVGAFAARLLMEVDDAPAQHGESVHLRSAERPVTSDTTR